jgi:hypothetical protein
MISLIQAVRSLCTAKALPAIYMCDILRACIVVAVFITLMYIDASKIYHEIRGQVHIRVYPASLLLCFWLEFIVSSFLDRAS